MKKCISYSLFGYGKERHPESFDFLSYLRGLMINVRMNRLLYPDWEIVLQTDQETYDAFNVLFDNIGIQVRVNDTSPLCLAMLWRLKPSFETENGKWKYTHVICRDLDSPPTYREVQAVKYWVNRDKAMHAITDSVSHNLPLLGGMIGMRPAYFNEKVGNSFDKMLALGRGMSFERKGSDQKFLCEYIYPKFSVPGSDSITQHYFNGMGNTHLSDYRTCTCPPTSGHESHCYNNIDIDIPYMYVESNSVCGHIGAAGFYSTAMFQFLRKHKSNFDDLIEVEKNYPNIFYWCFDGTFNN